MKKLFKICAFFFNIFRIPGLSLFFAYIVYFQVFPGFLKALIPCLHKVSHCFKLNLCFYTKNFHLKIKNFSFLNLVIRYIKLVFVKTQLSLFTYICF